MENRKNHMQLTQDKNKNDAVISLSNAHLNRRQNNISKPNYNPPNANEISDEKSK